MPSASDSGHRYPGSRPDRERYVRSRSDGCRVRRSSQPRQQWARREHRPYKADSPPLLEADIPEGSAHQIMEERAGPSRSIGMAFFADKALVSVIESLGRPHRQGQTAPSTQGEPVERARRSSKVSPSEPLRRDGGQAAPSQTRKTCSSMRRWPNCLHTSARRVATVRRHRRRSEQAPIRLACRS